MDKMMLEIVMDFNTFLVYQSPTEWVQTKCLNS